MVGTSEIRELLEAGGTVRGADGEKIGKIGDVYLDNAGSQPAWVTVRTGLLGTGQRFVPIDEATIADGALHVPFDKLTVLAAPSVEAEAVLTPDDEVELYDHYAVPVSTDPVSTDPGSDGPGSDRPVSMAEVSAGPPPDAPDLPEDGSRLD